MSTQLGSGRKRGLNNDDRRRFDATELCRLLNLLPTTTDQPDYAAEGQPLVFTGFPHGAFDPRADVDAFHCSACLAHNNGTHVGHVGCDIGREYVVFVQRQAKTVASFSENALREIRKGSAWWASRWRGEAELGIGLTGLAQNHTKLATVRLARADAELASPNTPHRNI